MVLFNRKQNGNCYVLDGVFNQEAAGREHFHEALALTETDMAAVETALRRRVLKTFVRRGLLAAEEA